MGDVPGYIEKIAKDMCRKKFMETWAADQLEYRVDMYWRAYIKEAEAEFAARIRGATG